MAGVSVRFNSFGEDDNLNRIVGDTISDVFFTSSTNLFVFAGIYQGQREEKEEKEIKEESLEFRPPPFASFSPLNA
jgi:hypothetical protein